MQMILYATVFGMRYVYYVLLPTERRKKLFKVKKVIVEISFCHAIDVAKKNAQLFTINLHHRLHDVDEIPPSEFVNKTKTKQIIRGKP